MKRVLAILLAALLAATLAVPAMADVIWEPMDDFYAKHRDECTYTDGDRYEAQTDSVVYETPESREQVAVIPAGESVFVEYTWDGDGLWGSVSLYSEEQERWVEGWVELDGFHYFKRYGLAEFEADHRGEIKEVDGDLTVTKEEPVYFWTFPGSGEIAGSFGGPDSWVEEETVSFYRVWTDEDGNDWGEIGYLYGLRDVWVYLADPQADSLPATAPRYAEEEPADPAAERNEDPVPTPAPATIRPVGPVITVVVIVLAAAVIAICVIKPKDEKNRR